MCIVMSMDINRDPVGYVSYILVFVVYEIHVLCLFTCLFIEMTFKDMIIMFNEDHEEEYYYNIKGCSHGLQERA